MAWTGREAAKELAQRKPEKAFFQLPDLILELLKLLKLKGKLKGKHNGKCKEI